MNILDYINLSQKFHKLLGKRINSLSLYLGILLFALQINVLTVFLSASCSLLLGLAGGVRERERTILNSLNTLCLCVPYLLFGNSITVA